ncbi:MAG: CRISPR-associated helicase Cas3' [Acidobacteriota bacterium]
MTPAFTQFFEAASSHTPYGYQCRLACGERQPNESQQQWLSHGAACQSRLIDIPTGLGKTAAVVLAWLWNRLAVSSPTWPRRLVYCLPMRVLVEQTRDNVTTWLFRLALASTADGSRERATVEAALAKLEQKQRDAVTQVGKDLTWTQSGSLVQMASDAARAELIWLCQHSPVVLMGGEDSQDWDLYPEKSAILVGTQDMLLSRALNRGYAMSRYRWPMHFGLLHTDCLWVFDEIQLMGSGLATTAQLEAFRNTLGQNGCATFWMSATLQKDWLKTVDAADPSTLPLGKLDEEDLQNRDVRERREARKLLQPTTSRMDDSSGLAAEILDAHQRAGGRTLVVVNTVKRARDLYHQLARKTKSIGSKPELVLIHSRFRREDRRRQVNRLMAEPGEHGMIDISTQVVEAGVDVSATTLFTELAPWASLVQRFGRCNRRGKDNDKAQVFWIGLPDDDKQHDGFSAPYRTTDLQESCQHLEGCQNVSPASLAKMDSPLAYQHGHILRSKDFVELFDTTPDLAGNDIDVERYVREVEECDVQVFWREWSADQPPPSDTTAPRREELCPVPVGEFRDFVKTLERPKLIFRWDYLDEQWLQVDTNRIFPGQVYLLQAEAGGYTADTGWDAKSSEKVQVLLLPQSARPPEANDTDPLSQSDWESIAQHTDRVCRELETILDGLSIADAAVLRLAARWHDFGKAHEAFQEAIDDGQDGRRARPVRWQGSRVIGKAPGRNKATGDPGWWRCYKRKHFRHELASALAVLMVGHDQIAEDVRNVVAYLVAAHHGKVRLSIRSLPEETIPPGDRRFARGVWDDDELPQTNLGGGVSAPAMKLSLEPMELGLCEKAPFAGQPSWADRMLRLRDKLGPFRLAYLEAILRAADMRASR